MKNTPILVLITCFFFSLNSNAQTSSSKIGCISITELLNVMPEFKKADTTLAKFRDTLEQQFEAMRTEYAEQANLLAGPDTTKYTPTQLVIKRQTLAELLAKIQGFDANAGQLFNQKRSILLLPIQKKAEDAIQQVSKDNGYAFVFEKDNLHVYPPSTDILPLVKKKLGL
ncbi:MAG: OmpH family outer membrane protein [Chitinophagaceae bacterium]|nr:OmpH family outer membrane protein [Chitinophagaceae bacterium]